MGSANGYGCTRAKFPSGQQSWSRLTDAVEGSRAFAEPGPDNFGTPTAVASLEELAWAFAIDSGPGLRS
jgi:hypothetical protein